MRVCPHCGHRGSGPSCPRDGFPLVEEHMLRGGAGQPDIVGRVFGGRYRVESLIGGGAMGWVFRARHEIMRSPVALKVMRRELVPERMAVERFYREARACSRLKYHHTIKVHDFGVSPDGYPFIVMEYLEGESLAAVLKREGSLAPVRAVRIATLIARALQEAHTQSFVHRDIKPANIFLAQVAGQMDYVKVLDFGIVKTLDPSEQDESITAKGALLGTPLYMSPEQAAGEPVDARSDLYSLGVLLYEMIAGTTPFNGKTVAELLAAHRSAAPPALDLVAPRGTALPAGLVRLVAALLRKDRSARPPNAVAVRRRLDAILRSGELGLHLTSRGVAQQAPLRARRGTPTTVDVAGTAVQRTRELAARTKKRPPSRSRRVLSVGLVGLLGAAAAAVAIALRPAASTDGGPAFVPGPIPDEEDRSSRASPGGLETLRSALPAAGLGRSSSRFATDAIESIAAPERQSEPRRSPSPATPPASRRRATASETRSAEGIGKPPVDPGRPAAWAEATALVCAEIAVGSSRVPVLPARPIAGAIDVSSASCRGGGHPDDECEPDSAQPSALGLGERPEPTSKVGADGGKKAIRRPAQEPAPAPVRLFRPGER